MGFKTKILVILIVLALIGAGVYYFMGMDNFVGYLDKIIEYF